MPQTRPIPDYAADGIWTKTWPQLDRGKEKETVGLFQIVDTVH